MFRNRMVTIAASLGAALAAAQLVPVRVSNPPSRGALAAPADVHGILSRSCYDCHSNETRWPWYARVAPLSWMVARDVEIGRREINFSEWGGYLPQTRKRKLQWMHRSLGGESMPPWSYCLTHPQARLDANDRAKLRAWIDTQLKDGDSADTR
jgi:hypothetical protein